MKAVATKSLMFTLLLIVNTLCSACTVTTDAIKKPLGNELASSGLFTTPKVDSYTPGLSGYAARSRQVEVDTKSLMSGLKAGKIRNITLNFFEDAQFRVIRKKQTFNTRTETVTWLGSFSTNPNSFAVLVISIDGINGSIDVPGIGSFTVRALPNGTHVVEEIKRSATR